jgi:hypothetical protein
MQLVLHRDGERGVRLKGGRDIPMADPGSHRFDVGSPGYEGGDMALAQTVRSEALDPSLTDEAIECSSHVRWVDWPTGGGRENQVVVDPVRGDTATPLLPVTMLR